MRGERNMKRTLIYAICLCAVLLPSARGTASGPAGEQSAIKGRVADAEGRAVENARVFAYENQEVRRPADFISTPTDAGGAYRLVLPPGKYWLVARLKKTEEYGPLMPGDKHSGEPEAIELDPGREEVKDFIVADLKEAKKLRSKQQDRPLKISGRILDEKGAPVANAYAIADRSGTFDGVPAYLSAWADRDGRYTLYLPRGNYFIGSASAVPPGRTSLMQGRVAVNADRSDLDIVRPSAGAEKALLR
jgi:hypothetical protein